MQHPTATRRQLHQTLLHTGQTLTAQGFEARFSPQAVAFLRAMVEAACQQVFAAESLTPLLSRFCGVYLTDCTRLETNALTLKVAARLELQQGSLQLSLEALQTHDNICQVMQEDLPAGALHVGDLGFFDLNRFARWQAAGVAWVSRYKTGTTLYHATGERVTVESVLAQGARDGRVAVWVGQQRLPVYLMAQRVSETCYQTRVQRLRRRASRKQQRVCPHHLRLARWTIYLTSCSDLSFAQVHTLYRARWQIERLFKRWKSLAHLTTSTTRDPHRHACEIYAKLLAVLVAHWLTQLHAWTATAPSFDCCFQTLQQHATWFYLACFRFPALLDLFATVVQDLLPALSLGQRKSRPNASHLWKSFDALP